MNEVFEKAVAELNLDRSDWQLVKFGDVAVQQKQTVDRENTELTRYVKGEHMYSEDMHLREWGELKDEYLGPAFIRKFEQGDILYGSRRTYLRKVVIAPFDGITSNTTFVIKANDSLVIRGVLPYIMMSEAFTQHSIKHSKGSVNPYVNWKDIANYEFLLPPLNQQLKLMELFDSINEVIESELTVLNKLDSIRYRLCDNFFISGNNNQNLKPFFSYLIPSHWDIKKMSDIASVEYGISKSVAKNTDPTIGWQIITGANINLDGSFDMSKKRYIEVPEKERFMLKNGDLMFNWRSGSPEHIGKTALFNLEGNYTYASFILRIRCGQALNNKFGFYLINFLREIEYFTKNVAKQVNFKINAATFREVEIPVPPIDEQVKICSSLDDVSRSIEDLNIRLVKSKLLRKVFINKVF